MIRWGVYVLIAVAFAIGCAFLSQWQFDRNEERARQIALVEQNYDATPESAASLLGDGSQLDPGDEWQPVRLRGEYLAEDQVLVRNRPHGGTSAFEVLVPFRDESGLVLFNRSWVGSTGRRRGTGRRSRSAAGHRDGACPAAPRGTSASLGTGRAGGAGPHHPPAHGGRAHR